MPGKWQGLGVSLFTAIAVLSIVLAVATVWLFLTNPVTVVNAVNEGEYHTAGPQSGAGAVRGAARDPEVSVDSSRRPIPASVAFVGPR